MLQLDVRELVRGTPSPEVGMLEKKAIRILVWATTQRTIANNLIHGFKINNSWRTAWWVVFIGTRSMRKP